MSGLMKLNCPTCGNLLRTWETRGRYRKRLCGEHAHYTFDNDFITLQEYSRVETLERKRRRERQNPDFVGPPTPNMLPVQLVAEKKTVGETEKEWLKTGHFVYKSDKGGRVCKMMQVGASDVPLKQDRVPEPKLPGDQWALTLELLGC